MKKIDVSVVLNMHRESLYLRSALLSLEACAAEARKVGIIVELIAIFDRPDQDTLNVFYKTPLKAFERIKTIEIDVGSLGLARNAGIQEAEGYFIWTSDGDDLVSRNSIVELIKIAKNHPSENVVVFLDYLIAFGEQYHVARYVGSQWLTSADFAYKHSFVSRIFIRKSVFDSLLYLDLKVTTGFAYEDWDFNSRLFAAGFYFAIAPNTVLFYRQRVGSLLRQANAKSAKMIPHSSLFEPKVYRAYMAMARRENPDWSSFIRSRQGFSERNFAQELMASDLMVSYVAEAAKLDPEVEPVKIERSVSYCPVPWDPKHWGFVLERFYELLGSGQFSDVLILPWLKPGGAEKYILQIAHELHTSGVKKRLLVLAGQAASKHEWVNKLPKCAVFIDVFNFFPMLDDAARDAMVVRALLAVSEKGAQLHIKASEFSHRLMDLYGSVLSTQFKIIYYSFSDENYSWRSKRFAGSWGIGFLRRNLHNIDLMVSDCHKIIDDDMARMGVHCDKYQLIYAKSATGNLAHMNNVPKQRLLWASRISPEKRPELVGAIAAGLRREFPSVIIEVYGQMTEEYQKQFAVDMPGVEYIGYFDGFDNLPLKRFDAFIYTSAFDGLPNVILEALGAGLPVIAPNVGGIGEAVIDGKTGFLIPDLDDEGALIAAYIDAIRRLYGNWDRIKYMAQNGRELIEKRHGESPFRRRVHEVFGIVSADKEAQQ